MAQISSTEDFDRLSWHDNHVYALRLSIGDIEAGDWRSDLVLDIDHIVEWLCGEDRRPRFLVAPAELTFHDVTDLGLALDWGDSGFRTALYNASIAGIERVRIEGQKICLDRPYYRWRIGFNSPRGGEIAFGASGFTQVLRADPVVCEEQGLGAARRGSGP